MQLVPLDPFYRAFDQDGTHFDFHADRVMQQEVARRSPPTGRDTSGCAVGNQPHLRRVLPVHRTPMMQLHVMMRMLPFLLRHRAALGVQRLVDGCIRDPFLRRALAFHPLLIGGHPAHTPALYALIVEFERRWGVHYAVGGTGALVDALGALLQRLGGASNAARRWSASSWIRARGAGCARGRRGNPADVVISNADPGYTYGNLLGMTPRACARADLTAAWRTAQPSMSLHVLYFGADRTWPDTPLAHHNLLLTGDSPPRARPGVRAVAPLARRGEPLTADDLFLYVHLPTRTDPTVAPAAARRCTCWSRHRRSTRTRRSPRHPRGRCAISWSTCSTAGYLPGLAIAPRRRSTPSDPSTSAMS